jgi:hypothetical protein
MNPRWLLMNWMHCAAVTSVLQMAIDAMLQGALAGHSADTLQICRSFAFKGKESVASDGALGGGIGSRVGHKTLSEVQYEIRVFLKSVRWLFAEWPSVDDMYSLCFGARISRDTVARWWLTDSFACFLKRQSMQKRGDSCQGVGRSRTSSVPCQLPVHGTGKRRWQKGLGKVGLPRVAPAAAGGQHSDDAGKVSPAGMCTANHAVSY